MSRTHVTLALAVCIVAVLGTAGGVGTIITSGATIQAGTGTPQGIVTIDPCAPEANPPARPPLGTLTTQGGFTGSLPAKPGTGAGGLGDVTITTDTFLPGGTYEYTNFEITNDATVTYGSGPTTILATGSVEIEGRIETFSSGESITIIAGDAIAIYVRNGTPITGIVTDSPGTEIRLEADRVEIGVTERLPEDGTEPVYISEVRAGGGITIRAHGVLPAALRSVDIQDSWIRANGGQLTIQSADDVFIGEALAQAQVEALGGRLLCQAFGDNLWLNGGDVDVNNASGVFECEDDLTLSSATTVTVSQGDLRLESFGRDVHIEDGSYVSADDGVAIGDPSGTGEVIVAAFDSVFLVDSSEIHSDGTGGIRVTAHGGVVRLERPDAPTGCSIECDREGGVLVEAFEDIDLHGTSGIEARTSPLVMRAHDGRVLMWDRPILSATNSDVDVRAATEIFLTPSTASGSLPAVTGTPRSISGESVLLVAGEDGIDISGLFVARTGFMTMHAVGSILLEGSAESGGGQGITLLSEDGSINVVDASVIGRASTADESGDVLLESFGGAGATIDATDAFIVSEDVTGESGDVSLLIHGAGAIESFVLPKVVKVNINAAKPEKSKLIAAGFFDTGPEAVDLTGPATITVGGLEFAANLQPKGKQKFLFKDDRVSLQIKVAGSGSSKSKFRLQIKTDLTDKVSRDGELTIRFATASADGQGTVGVENGKYKLGRKRGLLVAPNVFPFKLKQVHRGEGSDSFELLAGVATGGGTPEVAPTVTVGLRGGFEFTVPGDQFVRKGDKYVTKNPDAAPDVDLIQIDFRKEQLLVKAKNLDLGAIGGARPATIDIGLDEDMRAVSVRISPKSAKVLKY